MENAIKGNMFNKIYTKLEEAGEKQEEQTSPRLEQNTENVITEDEMIEEQVNGLSEELASQNAIFTDEGKEAYIKRIKQTALLFHNSNLNKSLELNTIMIKLFEVLSETTKRVYDHVLNEFDKGNKDIKITDDSALFSLIVDEKENFDKHFKENSLSGSEAIIKRYLDLVNVYNVDIVIKSLRTNYEIQQQKVMTYKKAKINFQEFVEFATEEQFIRIVSTFSDKRKIKRLFDSVNKPLRKKTGITTNVTNALVREKVKLILEAKNETIDKSYLNVATLSMTVLLCKYVLSKFNDNTLSKGERASLSLGLVHGGTNFESLIESFWPIIAQYMDNRYDNWKVENNVPEENEEVEESTVAMEEESVNEEQDNETVETEAASQEIMLPIEEETK